MSMFSNTSKVATIILVASIGLVLFLQLHNFLLFPLSRGLDAGAHIEYVNYLREYKRIPLAYEGWELYQPPLYYLAISAVYSTFAVKFLGLLVWLLLAVTSYKFFEKQFRSIQLALVGTFITASLPVVIYLTYTVSNEFFSGVLISIAIAYYAAFYNSNKISNKLTLGVLIGLSFLAKATGFILIASVVLDQLILARGKIIKMIRELFIPLGVAALISGWYYVRNIIQFGSPFVSSYDFPKIYPLHQVVVPRTFEFFLTLKGFYTLDLFNSHHYSFLSGTFFSWFYDGHNIIIPVQGFSKAGALLALLSVPMLIFFLIGYVKEIRVKKNRNTVFLLYIALLFAGYIAYNFRLPYYSTVKGVFLVSTVIPFSYFVLKGLLPYKKHIILISIYLAIYTLLLVKNFWILPYWHPNI